MGFCERGGRAFGGARAMRWPCTSPAVQLNAGAKVAYANEV